MEFNGIRVLKWPPKKGPKKKKKKKKKKKSDLAVFLGALTILLALIAVIALLTKNPGSGGVLNLIAAGMTLIGLCCLALADVRPIWRKEDGKRITPEFERRLNTVRAVGHATVLSGAVMLVGYYAASEIKQIMFWAILIYVAVVIVGLVGSFIALRASIKPETDD